MDQQAKFRHSVLGMCIQHFYCDWSVIQFYYDSNVFNSTSIFFFSLHITYTCSGSSLFHRLSTYIWLHCNKDTV